MLLVNLDDSLGAANPNFPLYLARPWGQAPDGSHCYVRSPSTISYSACRRVTCNQESISVEVHLGPFEEGVDYRSSLKEKGPEGSLNYSSVISRSGRHLYWSRHRSPNGRRISL